MGAATAHASLKKPGPVAANLLILTGRAFVAAARFAALS